MTSDVDIDRLAHRLRPHYSHFLAGLDDQALLTGHSHQAWPDVSREGQLACWDDAAQLIDSKWGRVFGEIMTEWQGHVATRLGSTRPQDITLAPNSHELATRLLSCFGAEARVVSTDGEFHSLSRQLDRLEEDGLRVTRVAANSDNFAERFVVAAKSNKTELAMLSQVFFQNSAIVQDLQSILQSLATLDIPVLVDAYHAFNAIEMNVDAWPGTVFVTGGGYKYAQAGEGACFMLLPADAEAFRPRHTGWFADFEHLDSPDRSVRYGPGGQRFFGATFDPSGLYRAVWTFRFFEAQGLTPKVLRQHSAAATAHLIEGFQSNGLAVATPTNAEERAAFVAVRHPEARSFQAQLKARGVHTDARGDLLRFGPAPYTRRADLDQAINAMKALAPST